MLEEKEQKVKDLRPIDDGVCPGTWTKFSGLTDFSDGVILEIQKGAADRRFAHKILVKK